jgi:CBS domain-containing protein
MKARDIMITDFAIISTKSLVADAVKQLKKNFGDESYMNAAPGLVVINEQGELAGILSPLTILRAIMDQSAVSGRPTGKSPAKYLELCQPLRDKLVEDIMDWQAISVTEDADLLDVADIFVKHRFQRIPVVSGKSAVGVIYRSRLMFALTTCLDGIV